MALYQQAVLELQRVKLTGFLEEFSYCIILIDNKIDQSATIHKAYLDSLSATTYKEIGLSIPVLHEKVRYDLINDINVKTSKVPNLQTIDLTRFMSTYKSADKVSCSAENNMNPTELPSDVMSNPDVIIADTREEVVTEEVVTSVTLVPNNIASSSSTSEREFAIVVSKKWKNILSPAFLWSQNPKRQQVGNKCPRKPSTIPLANPNLRFFMCLWKRKWTS
ncbi:hypothetical protein BGX38DRAFT_1161624 [Terfezia claveryi]|nr:hypothetical protein BGX38DRAFT_1161624 [Terfezia claveryi]